MDTSTAGFCTVARARYLIASSSVELSRVVCFSRVGEGVRMVMLAVALVEGAKVLSLWMS